MTQMNERSVLCTAASEGVECVAEATMTRPVPLCDEHRVEVALSVTPEVLAASLRTIRSGLTSTSMSPDERRAMVAGARPLNIRKHVGGVHGPVVYFIENGQRIKIGYSTNLRSRYQALSLQEKDVQLLLQGGPTLERAFHASFAKARIDATEWFEPVPALTEYITRKQAELSELMARSRSQPDRPKAAESSPAVSLLSDAILPPGPTYMDGKTIELKYRALWDALGECGTAGAVATELAAMELPGFISESNVRKTLRIWESRGYVVSVKDGRSGRFTRVDVLKSQHVREV